MQKLFNKILVPVDFSRRSLRAVDKAVDLANEYNCSITLLHVVTTQPFAMVAMADGHVVIPYGLIDNQRELQYRLEKIIAKVSAQLNHHEIKPEITLGSWDESIISYVVENKIDLVLIGQKSRLPGKRKMFLNPDKIAEKAGIPVITVPVNRRLTKLYSVLIPITDFLPVRKLMYGIYIAKMNGATIKLLSIQTNKDKELNEYYLRKAYRLINDNCNVITNIECIESSNTADGVSLFISKNPADLLILNPGTQTKMPGMFSSVFEKIIQKYTAAPVLTITPL